MMAMFAVNEDVATKADIDGLRTHLRTQLGDVRTELGDVRTEMAMIRHELDLKPATRDDLLDLRRDFDSNLKSFVRTFISVQAASMVGLTGIFYALIRLT